MTEGVEWLVLLIAWMALLGIGGAVIEMMLHWRERGWIRRLRGMEKGREAQRSGR